MQGVCKKYFARGFSNVTTDASPHHSRRRHGQGTSSYRCTVPTTGVVGAGAHGRTRIRLPSTHQLHRGGRSDHHHEQLRRRAVSPWRCRHCRSRRRADSRIWRTRPPSSRRCRAPGERRRLVATIIWLVRTRTLRRTSSASVVLDDRCLVGTVRRSLGRRDTQPRVRARRDRRGGATARCRAASLGSVRAPRSLRRRRQWRQPHRTAFRRHDR